MQLPMSFERSDFGRASIPVSLSENFCLYFADVYSGQIWTIHSGIETTLFIYLYFADRASQYIYLNINQLDALNFMSLFHASTCFEHECSSSGGQNCIIQSLVSSHL